MKRAPKEAAAKAAKSVGSAVVVTPVELGTVAMVPVRNLPYWVVRGTTNWRADARHARALRRAERG